MSADVTAPVIARLDNTRVPDYVFTYETLDLFANGTGSSVRVFVAVL